MNAAMRVEGMTFAGSGPLIDKGLLDWRLPRPERRRAHLSVSWWIWRPV